MVRRIGWHAAGAMILAGLCLATPASSEPDHCKTATNVLGVSRIVEIDTASGPLLGRQQYEDYDFLDDGEVVLTFDDGPLRRHTQRVLDALDRQCTRATFFVVGRMAVVDPAMVQEMDRRGHTVGTHTWSHRNLRASGSASVTKEFELGVSAASMALGKPAAPFFRFPYLADSKSAIAELRGRQQAVFSIDIDTKDFRTRSPVQVERTLMAVLRAKKKGIVLFHDIQPSTAGAIDSILEALHAGGYKVVHLVPKAGTTTVPAFDELAAKEFARRKSLAGKPLADRSVVWPIVGGDSSESAPVSALETPAALGAEERPGPQPATSKPNAQRRQPATKSAEDEDGDWALRILQ